MIPSKEKNITICFAHALSGLIDRFLSCRQTASELPGRAYDDLVSASASRLVVALVHLEEHLFRTPGKLKFIQIHQLGMDHIPGASRREEHSLCERAGVMPSPLPSMRSP